MPLLSYRQEFPSTSAVSFILRLALDAVDDDIEGRSGGFLGLVEVTVIDVIFVLVHELCVILGFLAVYSPGVSSEYLEVAGLRWSPQPL